MLFGNPQTLAVITLRRSETELPLFCEPLKAAPIYRRKYVPSVLFLRKRDPGRRIEVLEVTSLHVAEAEDVRGNVRSPRIAGLVYTLLSQRQRSLAVVHDRNRNRTDGLALA